MGRFATPKTYAAADVVLTIGGIPISGFADDSFVTVAFNSPLAEMSTGADGETVVNLNADKSANSTITLKETSDSNVYLRGLALAQQEAAAEVGAAPFKLPFVLWDTRTGEKVGSAHTVILTMPEIGKGKAAGDRAWELGLPYAEVIPAS